MRIVLDTNIVVSAIFFGGNPREIVELLMRQKIEVCASKEIIEEYKETVEYLKGKYAKKKLKVPIDNIISKCEIIDIKSKIEASRDSDDDKFINCAVDAKALYIVSGDKDLLVLNRWKEIEIITAKEFLIKYSQQENRT